MLGQGGNYGPQFRSGQPPIPPPPPSSVPPPALPHFQQVNSQMAPQPPPSFQQANFRMAPPPPPPSFRQAPNPTGQTLSQGLPPSTPVQYQPGLPAPPPQPTPPQGMMGPGQPYLHHAHPSQPQLYASPITTNSFTTPAPLPNRGPPPPPPSLSQGQTLYRAALPPSPGTQNVPPPPPALPSTSITSTNTPPYISFGCRPLDPGLPPALPPTTPPDPPPPPPPLVPSSPPPLPSSPPPPTTAANNVMDPGSKVQAVNQEINDSITGRIGEILVHNDSQVSNNVGKVSSTSGEDGLPVIPSPSASVKGRLPPLSVSVGKLSPVPAADSDMDMEDDEYSFCEDLSAPNSPIVTDSTKEVAVLESAKSSTSDARPSMVMSPIHGNKDGNSPRVAVNVGSPFTHIQGYASDDGSEDDQQKFISDVSPVRHSAKSASITLTSHVEIFDMHGASEATRLVTGSMQDASSVPVEIFNASVTKYPSQDVQNQNFTSSTQMEGTENDRIDNLVCHPEDDRILGEENVNSDALHQYFTSHQGKGDAHDQDRTFHSEEDVKEVSLVQRVNEFGRMVREAISDNDSDSVQYNGISGRRGSSSSRSHILSEENLSSEALHQYTTSEHVGGDAHYRDRAFHSEMDAKACSLVQKVDEFGRMVREGVSDSDSDGMQYRGRHGRRGRSSSRSLSPREDRWRSRGHWRRKEIRSKSRSWSPRRERVRSKSPPSHWHSGEFARGHTEATKCIYFLRGWCKHGASCRYLHEHGRNRSKAQKYRGIRHDSDRYDVEDHLREVYEGHRDFKNKTKESVIHDDISKEVKTYKEFQSRHDKSVSSIHDPVIVSYSMQIKDDDNDRMKSVASYSQCLEVGQEEHDLLELTESTKQEKALSTEEAENHHFSMEEGTLQNSEVLNNTSNNKIQSHTLPVDIENSNSETGHLQTCKSTISPHSLVTSPVPHPGSPSDALQQQHTEGSSMCHSSDALPTETFSCQSAAKPSSEQLTIHQPHTSLFDQPFRNQTPANQPLPEHMHATESCTSIIPTSGHQFHPQSTHPFAVHSAPPPYMPPIPTGEQFASSQQHSLGSSHHPVYPSQNSWSNIGRPPYHGGTSVPAFHNPEFDISHYTQNGVPPSQFQSDPALRPPVNNQYGGQSSYPLVSVDTRFSSGLPRYHHATHLHPSREDIKAPFQQQNIVSSSLTHGSGNHRESSFDVEPFARQIQSFPRDNMALRAFSKEDFNDPAKGLTYPHHHPVAGSQQSAGGVFPSSITASNITGPPFIGHPTNFPENNLMSISASSGLSKISAAVHYNPFASTFEKHHGPRLSALDSRIEGTPFAGADKKFSLEASIEVAAGTQMRHGKEASASDPYDPLFDSIDGSSNILKKFNHSPNKDTASVAGVQATNFGSDELGETATDAEAGAVEDGSPLPGIGTDWSPGIQVDAVNRKGGEVDIERLPSQGNSKKGKDSRSMKLFRIAIANFVKEVLKPSWRQGNMSKEAFKTIVKKTVDKVCSTMPGHRVPKSQAKIDQYVESSQRKLTKLVMGYVDKYVKV